MRNKEILLYCIWNAKLKPQQNIKRYLIAHCFFCRKRVQYTIFLCYFCFLSALVRIGIHYIILWIWGLGRGLDKFHSNLALIHIVFKKTCGLGQLESQKSLYKVCWGREMNGLIALIYAIAQIYTHLPICFE